ncbi:hypothetical protein HDZ31DRAFT_70635, partial [Schizophyllum fasciatum]
MLCHRTAAHPRYRTPIRCCINRLPDELLEIIFVLSLPEALADPVPGIGATYVAYMRHSGVLNYPAVFALDGAVAPAPAENSPPEWKNAYYTDLLARSGSRSLTLSVDGGRDDCTVLLVRSPFIEVMHRLRRLCVNLNHFETTDNALLLLQLINVKSPTPLLQTYHMHVGADCQAVSAQRTAGFFDDVNVQAELGRVYPAFSGVPHLESFPLEGLRHVAFGTPVLLLWAAVPLTNLTCLRLPESPCYAIDVSRVMTHMPRLRVLRCSLYEDEDEDEREQLEAAYAEEDIAHTFDGL